MTKFVFVTGGVMSGIGKGITAASTAKLFQFRGFKVSIVKIDPYLNVDPGTLNPIEHGECFVTETVWNFQPAEGSEVFRISEIDQDFGSYERFLNVNIPPSHNITSGQIYLQTILKERKGEYLGHTVQIIPHCTDIIKDRIKKVAQDEKLDALIIEVGGTVGDIESTIFLEAIRQLRLEVGRKDTVLIHVTFIPYSEAVGQLKSKPTQHSVKMLQAAGLQPDFLICRSPVDLDTDPSVRSKISLFSNLPPEAVISNPDLDCIYELPLIFERQNLGDSLCFNLDLKPKTLSCIECISEWRKTVDLFKNGNKEVTIAMPGKYTTITDSYVSINAALKDAGAHLGTKVHIRWVDTENLDENAVLGADGVLNTPGFGSRGVEGMIRCAELAMENRIPYLGICFGCQLLYVAYCRKYLGLEGANSTEIDPKTPYPVVDKMEEQKAIQILGGTMRLGGHPIVVKPNTRLSRAYKQGEIVERFRHRYHIMDDFIKKGENKGLIVSAVDKTGKIVNALELNWENYFCVGTQFHPEFKSRPTKPSPIYSTFMQAVIEKKYGKSG